MTTKFKLKKWIFTWGFGQGFDNCYISIPARDEDEARFKMNANFGSKWGFQYPNKNKAMVKEFNLKEVKWTAEHEKKFKKELYWEESYEKRPKIFIVVEWQQGNVEGVVNKYNKIRDGDIAGVAIAQDGQVLASHLSTNKGWLRSDLGLTSKSKHDLYESKYPKGYEIIDCINSTNNEELEFALYLNSKRQPKQSDTRVKSIVIK